MPLSKQEPKKLELLRKGYFGALSLGMLFSFSMVHAAPGVPKTGPSKNSKNQAPVRVLTAMSTPLKSGHPVLFLNSDAVETKDDRLATRLQFPADQRYSKWSVIFESPLRIEAAEIETCPGTKPFSDGVELFLDYHERRLFSDGGRRVVKFKVKAPARALTFHFLESPGLCLERIRLKTNGEWMRPRVLAATGSAVLADGNFGLSTRHTGEGKKKKVLGARKTGEWMLEWENPLIVESVRVWNGNQYPGDVFNENDRVREIEILADGVRAAKATLEDRRYSQQVEIKEPRAVRTLDLKSLSTYPGTIESEPSISEIQLTAGGENWIPVVPVTSSATENGESLEAAVIREKGYGDILDRELRADERGEVWKFRFRSDGTFFARVFVDRARVAKSWSVSGTWRIGEKITVKPDGGNEPKNDMSLSVRSLSKSFAKSGATANQASKTEAPGLGPVAGLPLVLVGTKIATAESFDSLPCASACFSGIEDRGPSEQRELPVLEQIELQRDRRTLFFIRNRTEQEKRTLEFTDLKLRIHSLYD